MRSIGGGRRNCVHVHGDVSALVYSQSVASWAGSASLPNAGAADGEAAEETAEALAETQGNPIAARGRGFSEISWNACGMESGAIDDYIYMLEDLYWDAVLLQEGPFAEENSCRATEGGHLMFSSVTVGNRRTACIVINRRWADSKTTFTPLSRRMDSLDLDAGDTPLTLVSAHLPHDEGTNDDT